MSAKDTGPAALLVARLVPRDLVLPWPSGNRRGVAITVYGRDFPALGWSLTSGEGS